jgi:ribosomal protein S8
MVSSIMLFHTKVDKYFSEYAIFKPLCMFLNIINKWRTTMIFLKYETNNKISIQEINSISQFQIIDYRKKTFFASERRLRPIYA